MYVDIDSQKVYLTSMFTDMSICIYSACACCVFGVEMPCVQIYVGGVLAAVFHSQTKIASLGQCAQLVL